MANRETDIPQKVQKGLGKRRDGVVLGSPEQKQQIDVGVGMEFPASIATNGDKRHTQSLWYQMGEFGEGVDEDTIDQLGA